MSRSIGEQSVYLRGSRDTALRLPTKEDEEGKRLNTQHRLLAAVPPRRHYFAPVTNPKMMLDVASGTGVWGVDMAHHFQQATIDNLDSNQYMGEQWLGVLTARRVDLRKRVRVVGANALQSLSFKDDTYDFTHGRFLEVFVPYGDWPRLVRELVRVTRPGGWIELVGGEYPELETPAYVEMRAAVIRLLGSLDLHLHAPGHYAEWLKEAGAEKVKGKTLLVGRGSSQRAKLAENFVAAAQALRNPLVAARLMTPDRFEALLPRVQQEIIENELVWLVRACWGRKPSARVEGGQDGI